MQIFKDKNACLKIRTSYFILWKYLNIKNACLNLFQKRTSIFFLNINSLRVCILKSNQCTH